jgi:glutathione synthase/RimK-type ligase-like ATP-grasp enzyme
MDVSGLLEQAREALERGEFARAKELYVKVLLRDRYDHDGMLGLSDAFAGLEDFESARVVLVRAAERHATSSTAHSALGAVLLECDDLAGARAAFEASLRLNPAQRKSWAGLGVVFERTGDLESADRAWREAFRDGDAAISTYRGDGEPLRVLVLRSAVDGNIPLRTVLDDRIHQWITLFVESFHEGMTLPEHQVIFNVVGNADLRTRALDKAEAVLGACTARTINPPACVRESGRARVAERLRDVPGIVTPRMRVMQREALLRTDPELGWPLLVRSLGFNTGKHFVKIAEPSHLSAAIAALPGDELLAIEYLDTRSRDGIFRKYRVLTIDGQLHPLHLAGSSDWKVHNFSADRGAGVLAEERAFLEDMTSAIGSDATRALQRASDILGFDYGGVDFALDREGRVVVFEANPTMVIVLPEEPSHRREAAERAIHATRAMIARRASS